MDECEYCDGQGGQPVRDHRYGSGDGWNDCRYCDGTGRRPDTRRAAA